MPSPTAARASVSVPTAASPAPEVTAARLSVSSPTWSSYCGPAESLGTRWGPKADNAASPSEGATAKAAGSHKGVIVNKPATSPVAMAPIPAPAPAPGPVIARPSASPSAVSAKAPSADPTAR
uniref:Uncharacterized protein n=1 Tax=Catagonus wagneri TaxID=51154 RepID=A0A8C3VS52_9CETA